MDKTDIKTLVSNTQIKLLGRCIDARTLSYWVNIITSGRGNIENFIDSIITSTEYALYLTSIFKDEFYSIIGYIEIENYLNEFNNYSKLKIKETNKPLSYEEVKLFITTLDCFREKYYKLIKSEYTSKFNKECDDKIIQYHISNFKSKYNFNSDQLLKGVCACEHITTEQPCIIDIIEKNSKSLLIETGELCNFHSVFNRPMFVEEYFYYIINGNKEDYKKLFETYTTNLNKYTKIIHDYKNNKPSEYDFVKSYIPFYEIHRDDQQFFNSIVDDIVFSSEYENEMKQIISKKYYSLYNEALESDDRDYYFSIIKQYKLNLRDDKVEIQLMNLKKETDEFIGNIFDIFTNVLDRKPDEIEIASMLSMYREQNDTELVNIQIEKGLVTSIEFNEIIKKKLKENNPNIIPSKLYSLINNIVKKINIADMMYDDVCEMLKDIPC